MPATAPKTTENLRLGLDLGLAVRHLDAQLLRLRDDVDALACRDGVGDPVPALVTRYMAKEHRSESGNFDCERERRTCVLCGEGVVVHEEELNVTD